MKKAELIIDHPEKNMDLYYAARFTAPDPYIYLKTGGKKYLLTGDLEIDRAKKQALVDHVLSLSRYLKTARKNAKSAGILDALIVLLNEKNIKKLIVPESMPFAKADYLRKKGFKLEGRPEPFYTERYQKTETEFRYILSAQKAVFSAIKLAEDILRCATIGKNLLYYKGKPLTSEIVREEIKLHLFKKGFIADDTTIVACGRHSLDPHDPGSGPLRAHQSIIVDIYPRSMKTLYYGDATRTFCKGKAPDQLKKMYNLVKAVQLETIKKIRPGMNGRKIHEGIVKLFGSKGYPTGEKNGRMEGFFHGTGHSIGLEVHEEPLRINPKDHILLERSIMSIEPGLYYKDIGGVRIEDLVYITKTGCQILGSYPKRLEVL